MQDIGMAPMVRLNSQVIHMLTCFLNIWLKKGGNWIARNFPLIYVRLKGILMRQEDRTFSFDYETGSISSDKIAALSRKN